MWPGEGGWGVAAGQPAARFAGLLPLPHTHARTGCQYSHDSTASKQAAPSIPYSWALLDCRPHACGRTPRSASAPPPHEVHGEAPARIIHACRISSLAGARSAGSRCSACKQHDERYGQLSMQYRSGGHHRCSTVVVVIIDAVP